MLFGTFERPNKTEEDFKKPNMTVLDFVSVRYYFPVNVKTMKIVVL